VANFFNSDTLSQIKKRLCFTSKIEDPEIGIASSFAFHRAACPSLLAECLLLPDLAYLERSCSVTSAHEKHENLLKNLVLNCNKAD